MSAKMEMELDPKRMLEAIKKLENATKALSEVMEKSLGKDAVKAVEGLDKAAEQGATSISSRFKDLGKRIQEDLKSAFAVGQLAAGLKLAEYMGQGIKEVFNLERAFDKLNTRLQLTGRTFQDFKNNIGKSVASTGQKLEDIFPGIETAAAKGGVKSPKELADIGLALAKVRAATGENTENLADVVVKILQNQGKQVTARSFQDTLNVLQGTRVAGAFKTAGEAGSSIEAITHGISKEQLAKMGLGTRELGGLAAQASKAGAGAEDVLQHMLSMATQAGGKHLLNEIFNTQLFKGEKLDIGALTKANKNRFGQYSEQVMAQATGADQAGLSRFLDAMKSGQENLKKVTQGSDEAAKQYALATDNLATTADRYTQNLVNATRSIGDSMSTAVHDFLKGNFMGSVKESGKALSTAWENKGTMLSGLGISVAAGLLTGGGAKRVMGMFGGTAKGLAEGKALQKAAGVEPVYVVNATEIGSAVGGASGILSQVGGFASKLGLVGAVAGIGVSAGSALAESETGQGFSEESGLNKLIDSLINALDGSKERAQTAYDEENKKFKDKTGLSHEDFEKLAVTIGKHVGTAVRDPNKPTLYINTSAAKGGAPVQ